MCNESKTTYLNLIIYKCCIMLLVPDIHVKVPNLNTNTKGTVLECRRNNISIGCASNSNPPTQCIFYNSKVSISFCFYNSNVSISFVSWVEILFWDSRWVRFRLIIRPYDPTRPTIYTSIFITFILVWFIWENCKIVYLTWATIKLVENFQIV